MPGRKNAFISQFWPSVRRAKLTNFDPVLSKWPLYYLSILISFWDQCIVDPGFIFNYLFLSVY